MPDVGAKARNRWILGRKARKTRFSCGRHRMETIVCVGRENSRRKAGLLDGVSCERGCKVASGEPGEASGGRGEDVVLSESASSSYRR
jgi:hypothetical protein